MKIFKVWQNAIYGYDTYDSCVVIAEGVNRAKRLSIDTLCGLTGNYHRPTGTDRWTTDIHQIHAKEIGTTDLTDEQIVLASFNAG